MFFRSRLMETAYWTRAVGRELGILEWLSEFETGIRTFLTAVVVG